MHAKILSPIVVLVISVAAGVISIGNLPTQVMADSDCSVGKLINEELGTPRDGNDTGSLISRFAKIAPGFIGDQFSSLNKDCNH